MGLFDKLFKKATLDEPSEEAKAAVAEEVNARIQAMITGGSAIGHDNVPHIEELSSCGGSCSSCSSCGSGCTPSSCSPQLGGSGQRLTQGQEAARANREEETTGWDAITHTFEKFYPGQKAPLHFAAMVPWSQGGPDPLDGISVYDGRDYYHFVTYGLTELYGKTSDLWAYSGYGFEFTLKLKKAGLGDTPDQINRELRNVAGILQSLARLTFQEGKMFAPDEYIYTGQTKGIDADGRSNLVGFITRLDNAGVVETPHGWVKFTELIGVTEAELQGIKAGWITVPQLYEALGSDWTDYNRISMM